MSQKWHRLKGNKKRSIPTLIVLYDCETKPIEVAPDLVRHELKLGVACCLFRFKGEYDFQEEWCTFRTKEEFWEFVLSRLRSKSRLYLIAHNQHFDFAVVDGFLWLSSRGWNMTQPILDSNLFIVSFKKDNESIMVCDSLNWFKSSLSQLGKNVGLEKLEIDFDTCTDEELEIYCKRDVEITVKTLIGWLNFIREHDLGNFSLTIASQAFNAFRHRFMDYPITIHRDEKTLEFEREAYRGGRTECFVLGEIEGNIHSCDINSLYPFVMQKYNFPVCLLSTPKPFTLEMLKRALKEYLVVARVNIEINEPCIAIKDERLLFPIGRFNAVLTTPEIQYILEHHKIHSVGEVAVYQQAPIFEEWVKSLYGLRTKYKKEKNELYDGLTKLLMNSLYGKFGQFIEDIEEIGEAAPDIIMSGRVFDMENSLWYSQWVFGGKVFRKSGEKREWTHSSPVIAAHVCAHARMELWNTIKIAGRDNVFYVDTDSVMVNEEGLENLQSLINPTKLGALKYEGSADSVHIYGLKDYVFGEKVRCKGRSPKAESLGEGVFKQEQFLKFRSLIKLGSLDAPLVKTVTKELKREYKKGIVEDSGIITPFVRHELPSW